MRQECQVMLPDGICGKPSVDSIVDPGSDDGRFWLCADHWDDMHAEDIDEDGYYSYEFDGMEDDEDDDDEDD